MPSVAIASRRLAGDDASSGTLAGSIHTAMLRHSDATAATMKTTSAMTLPRLAQGSDHFSSGGTGTSMAIAVPTAAADARSTDEALVIRLAHSIRQMNATVNCGTRVRGPVSVNRSTA